MPLICHIKQIIKPVVRLPVHHNQTGEQRNKRYYPSHPLYFMSVVEVISDK